MIDKNKTYRTRDGREVRIYATDGGGMQPIHGAIFDDDIWLQQDWYARGTINPFSDTSDKDLIEVKPRIKRTVWLNVWSNNVRAFRSAYDATEEGKGRIACVKVEIDCEEGDGL